MIFKRLLKNIDSYLDGITMYRLVLYILIALLFITLILSSIGKLPYAFESIVLSAVILLAVSQIINKFFSRLYNVPTNVESSYITALILALIIIPAGSFRDILFLAWAAVFAIASKYLLAINKKHVFNPAAVSMVISSIVLGQSAGWWIGTGIMAPFVIISGFLIVRKIRRTDLVLSFLTSALITITLFTVSESRDVLNVLNTTIFYSAYLFFAFIMLTEPQTTPPTNTLQIMYGTLVGILFSPGFHFGNLYFSPESALITGNLFSYLVGPRQTFLLRIKEKIKTASVTYEFILNSTMIPVFKPGQYMEWTLEHSNPDSRGNRRYFSIASSPTEDVIRLGIKFSKNGSSFKNALLSADKETIIAGSQLAGDFTLPKNNKEKLVFIAGGIGITPFRSMLKYLIDIKEKRSIILFYSNKSEDEIIYEDILHKAEKELNIKVIYTLTDMKSIPDNWQGETGRISSTMIKNEVPDYKFRTYYLSGPHNMVTSFEDVLSEIGVRKNQIVKDYFPGYV